MSDLLPVEDLSLTMALAQIERGDAVSPGVAIVCALALARITGKRGDWTKPKETP
jgi:hypothetical protein